jgi:hypothetical protein
MNGTLANSVYLVLVTSEDDRNMDGTCSVFIPILARASTEMQQQLAGGIYKHR